MSLAAGEPGAVERRPSTAREAGRNDAVRRDAAVYVYPWDVVGDLQAAERIAALGVQTASLATLYHSTRALTPFHPEHRIVTAEYAAGYYRTEPARWAGRRLTPVPAQWGGGEGSFESAADALRGAGLKVAGWTVLVHGMRFGSVAPDLSVVNAYGDRYPWAPCAAQPEVAEYVRTAVSEVAALPQLDTVELESCGWYGLDHLHAHDKMQGVFLAPAHRFLMSLCFCPACGREYEAAGVTADELRGAVRGALDPVFAGASWSAAEPPTAASLLGEELADRVLAMRQGVADRLRVDAIAQAKAEGKSVIFQGALDPLTSGAYAAVPRPGEAFADADGLLLAMNDPDPEVVAQIARRALDGRVDDGQAVYASVAAVARMGGFSGDSLVARAALLGSLGVTGIRYYHAGLASRSDLDGITAAVAAFATAQASVGQTPAQQPVSGGNV